jgi:hypothetical protein
MDFAKLMIPQDKANHFLWGAAISAAVSRATGDRVWGLGAAVALAVAKEVYDRVSGKGTPDLKDAMWTVLGGLCPWAAGGEDPL